MWGLGSGPSLKKWGALGVCLSWKERVILEYFFKRGVFGRSRLKKCGLLEHPRMKKGGLLKHPRMKKCGLLECPRMKKWGLFGRPRMIKWCLLERPRLKKCGLFERTRPKNGCLYCGTYSYWPNMGVPPASNQNNNHVATYMFFFKGKQLVTSVMHLSMFSPRGGGVGVAGLP